jgi:quercetin dioxygenase-like cupin family protein
MDRNQNVRATLQFPFHFDAVRLQADFARLIEGDWVPHFNRAYYEGDWSAVPLRSIGGLTGKIYPDPTREDYLPTEILARSPYFEEVLARFKCPMLSARLLRLKAGSRIKEHTDLKLGFEDGEVRIHVSIHTNPDVEFYVRRERVILGEGECWYINTNLPHAVANLGASDRIHLVMDCQVNDWLGAFFAE